MTDSKLVPPKWVMLSPSESYQPTELLGIGSAGEVWHCQNSATLQVVAIKRTPLLEVFRDGKYVSYTPASVLIEREMVTLLSPHPNILPVSYNHDSYYAYLIMPYVARHTLFELAKRVRERKEVLKPTVAKQLFRGILSAVAHAHSKGITHRDISSTNILINGSTTMVYLIDWGWAKILKGKGNESPNAQTLWYRSPEVLIGRKDYTQAIDMWSVGCIFFELLTMTVLFYVTTELNLMGVIQEELGETIDPSYEYKPDPSVKYQYINTVPEKGGARDLLKSMLQMDPKKRITAQDALKHPYFKEEEKTAVDPPVAAKPVFAPPPQPAKKKPVIRVEGKVTKAALKTLEEDPTLSILPPKSP